MRGEVQFRSDKLAVLIDADNTSANVVEALLREIAKFGTAYIKRIYGDWTTPQMNAWKKILNDFAILPIQQFGYTSGKNSTDSALIIDAMDLLYTDKLDGFCIVSSDSDFTRLAHRIRQDGIVVYGFGKRQTPQAFVAACDRFIYTELLDQHTTEASSNIVLENFSKVESSTKVEGNNKLDQLLKEAYDGIARDDGLANLGTLGQQLSKLDPSFDTRTYGHKKLGELLKATGIFEVKGNDVRLK
ncbi:NYN domain-containing protein [Pannus brasiliensis CCIBt3594]|uniref:NYN domain-containing protein n=1 Tax=Pannus brasiliensis CCIBt3594 TaxID=1427578 RepID=A0AAW9R0P6_9CHRO